MSSTTVSLDVPEQEYCALGLCLSGGVEGQINASEFSSTIGVQSTLRGPEKVRKIGYKPLTWHFSGGLHLVPEEPEEPGDVVEYLMPESPRFK